MQRKYLEGLKIEGLEGGLPKEIIDSIMSENGKDVEAARTKLSGQIENLKSELESKDEMLTNVNSEIEKYKGMDIESIKKSATEWEDKYKNFEAQSKADKDAYEQKLKDQAYDFTLKEAISNLKFPNELTKNAFMNELKAKQLPLEGEKLLGFEDYIKEVGEKNPGLFVTETQQTNEPQVQQFAASTSGGGTPVTKIPLQEAMERANKGEIVDFNQIQGI